MFRTVLVSLDGHPDSEAAAPFAEQEARRHGAQLVLVRLVSRPELAPGFVSRGGPTPAVHQCTGDERDRIVEGAKRYLRGVIDRYGLDPSAATTIAIGDPYLRLRFVAGLYPAPLVVAATTTEVRACNTASTFAVRRLSRDGALPVLALPGTWMARAELDRRTPARTSARFELAPAPSARIPVGPMPAAIN